MGNLPDSRSTTLNPGDTLPSVLIDEIQDCIISGNIGDHHSSRPLSLSAFAFQGTQGVFPTYSVGGTAALSGGTAGLVASLPNVIRVGNRLLTASFVIQDSAAPLTKIRAHIKSFNSAGALVDDVVSPDSAGSGVIQTVNFAMSPLTIVAGLAYVLQVNYGSGTGNLILTKFDLTHDRP